MNCRDTADFFTTSIVPEIIFEKLKNYRKLLFVSRINIFVYIYNKRSTYVCLQINFVHLKVKRVGLRAVPCGIPYSKCLVKPIKHVDIIPKSKEHYE